jgi:hypothetical protein
MVDGFLWFGLKTGGDGFPGLGLKTGSSSLMIWASKSPRRFLGLVLKTMQALICQLRHKTNEERTARDTRRDLAACFTWKQVALRFPNLALRLAEAQWWVVHATPSRRLRRDQVEDTWVNMMDCVEPRHHYFVVSYVLGPRGIVVF